MPYCFPLHIQLLRKWANQRISTNYTYVNVSRKCPTTFQNVSRKCLRNVQRPGDSQEVSGVSQGDARKRLLSDNVREISGRCAGNVQQQCSTMSRRWPGNVRGPGYTQVAQQSVQYPPLSSFVVGCCTSFLSDSSKIPPKWFPDVPR